MSRETYLEANGRTSRRRASRKWTAEGFVEHFKWVPSRQKYACLRVVKRAHPSRRRTAVNWNQYKRSNLHWLCVPIEISFYRWLFVVAQHEAFGFYTEYSASVGAVNSSRVQASISHWVTLLKNFLSWRTNTIQCVCAPETHLYTTTY